MEPLDALVEQGLYPVDAEHLADALRLSGIAEHQLAAVLGTSPAQVSRWCEREIPLHWMAELREIFPSLQQTIPARERHIYLAFHMRKAGVSFDDLRMRLGIPGKRLEMWITGDEHPTGRYLRALLREFPGLYTRE